MPFQQQGIQPPPLEMLNHTPIALMQKIMLQRAEEQKAEERRQEEYDQKIKLGKEKNKDLIERIKVEAKMQEAAAMKEFNTWKLKEDIKLENNWKEDQWQAEMAGAKKEKEKKERDAEIGSLRARIMMNPQLPQEQKQKILNQLDIFQSTGRYMPRQGSEVDKLARLMGLDYKKGKMTEQGFALGEDFSQILRAISRPGEEDTPLTRDEIVKGHEAAEIYKKTGSMEDSLNAVLSKEKKTKREWPGWLKLFQQRMGQLGDGGRSLFQKRQYPPATEVPPGLGGFGGGTFNTINEEATQNILLKPRR